MNARLLIEPRRVDGAWLEAAATLQHEEGKRERLWWRVPTEWGAAVTEWADPFVVGLLFPMMQGGGGDVWVEGKVSPSLLANLELLMELWRAWDPNRYRVVKIRAVEEVEMSRGAGGGEGEWVVPFSSGVDSCFTLYRHRRGGGVIGRRAKRIGAAVVMEGFDIVKGEMNAEARYAEIVGRARRMVDSMGVPLIPMGSNFRELSTCWADSHASQLASGLMLLGGGFVGALIPNSVACVELGVRWGSHPLSDPLMGSRGFEVRDDGVECVREEKCAVIKDWPEAMAEVKVCFSAAGNLGNCCVCEKCIRSIVAFRIAGAGLPAAFKQDVTDRQIRRAPMRLDLTLEHWESLAVQANARGYGKTSWAKAIRHAVNHEHRRRKIAALKGRFIPLRNAIRRVFRGKPKVL